MVPFPRSIVGHFFIGTGSHSVGQTDLEPSVTLPQCGGRCVSLHPTYKLLCYICTFACFAALKMIPGPCNWAMSPADLLRFLVYTHLCIRPLTRDFSRLPENSHLESCARVVILPLCYAWEIWQHRAWVFHQGHLDGGGWGRFLKSNFQTSLMLRFLAIAPSLLSHRKVKDLLAPHTVCIWWRR